MKAAFLEQFARIGTALSNPSRLALLDLLCQSEKTVETLVEQSNLPLKNVSAQLKVLREAGLIQSRKDGKYVRYSLSDDRVGQFWAIMQSFAGAQIHELHELAMDLSRNSGSLTGLGKRELLAKAKKGEIVVVDVRPADEFAAGHLPYAVSLPLVELRAKLKSLPKNKEIVAYCRGPYCLFASGAVQLLRQRGYRAYRLEEGVQEWKAAGLRVIAS